MNLLDPVSKIMATDLITITENASVFDAGVLFKKHKIHHVPVIDGDKLIGLVSKTDYLHFKRGYLKSEVDKALETERLQLENITSIMTTGIAKLEPTDRINVVIAIFKENLFHAIPIIDEGKLVGIVTTQDIIQNLDKDKGASAEYTLK